MSVLCSSQSSFCKRWSLPYSLLRVNKRGGKSGELVVAPWENNRGLEGSIMVTSLFCRCTGRPFLNLVISLGYPRLQKKIPQRSKVLSANVGASESIL